MITMSTKKFMILKLFDTLELFNGELIQSFVYNMVISYQAQRTDMFMKKSKKLGLGPVIKLVEVLAVKRNLESNNSARK